MPQELGDFFTFLIFLFYGLVFFTTGVAITSKVTRGSKLKIARYLPLFAIFAFVHAVHEWLVLFLYLEWPALPKDLLPIISRSRLLPVSLSYIFLLLYGYFVLQAVYPRKRALLRIVALALPVILFCCLLYGGLAGEERFFRFAAMRIRNLLGFPGALAAGLGLIGYAGTIRGTSGKVARNFTGAGVALIAYGIFAGLVPTGAVLPPGVRVELLRGVTGMFILHFLMNALHIFDLEREELLFEELVSHGQGSGDAMATMFSNTPESYQTSLGLFRTLNSYYGRNGYSLRLEGLEAGVNDLAYQRAIVIHGADYVSEAFIEKTGRLGRSHGCPAVRQEVTYPLIDSIKGEHYLFAYYPDPEWLESSAVLNCDRDERQLAMH